MQPPLITVLMPVYNGDRYLQEAIQSILQQTLQDFEFLIVNDGSQDKSAQIVSSFADPRIRFIDHKENRGLVPTLQEGLSLARGKYLARMDADDIALPARLQRQVAALDADPGTVLVGSWVALIDEDGETRGTWRFPSDPQVARWRLLFNTVTAHSAVMFRLNAVRAIGGYSSAYLHAEDYELWSRLSESGAIYSLPEVLIKYRVHAGAVSSLNQQAQSEARLRIASRNIGGVLEDELDPQILPVLTGHRSPTTRRAGVQVIDAFSLLARHFIDRHGVEAETARIIRADVLARLGDRLQALPALHRARCLAVRPRSFPFSFWASGRFVLFLINDTTKKRIKHLFGTDDQALSRF